MFSYIPGGIDGLTDDTVSMLVRLDYFDPVTETWGDSFYCLYAGLPWQQDINEESLVDDQDDLKQELRYCNSISIAKATEFANTGNYTLTVITKMRSADNDLFHTEGCLDE